MPSQQVSMNPTRARPHQLLILGFLATLLVAPTRPIVFTWDGQELVETSALPPGSKIDRVQSRDLDNDGQPETIHLEDGKAKIHSGDRAVWTSPDDWDVKQAEVTDLNRDGSPEVTLLVWRPYSPWPIDAYIPHPGRIQDFHDRKNRSCHLILIGWRRGAYRELWAGSALADPLVAFTPIDINQDGQQELAALESRYDAPPIASRAISLWEWNGFGFSLLKRGPPGFYHSLNTIETPTGQERLVAQGFLRR